MTILRDSTRHYHDPDIHLTFPEAPQLSVAYFAVRGCKIPDINNDKMLEDLARCNHEIIFLQLGGNDVPLAPGSRRSPASIANNILLLARVFNTG